MTVQFNGFANAGDFLGKNLQYYTLITTVDIRPSGLVAPYWEVPVFPVTDVDGNVYNAGPAGGADEIAYTEAWLRQQAFDKVIEVISERGQPVLLGPPREVTGPSGAVAGLEAYGTGPGPLYVFRFALEHELAWRVEETPGGGVTEGVPEEYLDYRLDGVKLYEGNVDQNIPTGTLPGEPYVGADYGPSFSRPVPEFVKDTVSVSNNNVTIRRSEELPLDIDY